MLGSSWAFLISDPMFFVRLILRNDWVGERDTGAPSMLGVGALDDTGDSGGVLSQSILSVPNKWCLLGDGEWISMEGLAGMKGLSRATPFHF